MPTRRARPRSRRGDTPDPCSLLTAEELTELTGVEFGEGTFNEDLSAGGNQICDWLAVDAFDTVQVLINPDSSGFPQSRDGAVDAGMEVVDVDIEVAGADAAYIVEGGIVATALGDMFVQVSYLASGDTAEQAVEIAEVAVSRLL